MTRGDYIRVSNLRDLHHSHALMESGTHYGLLTHAMKRYNVRVLSNLKGLQPRYKPLNNSQGQKVTSAIYITLYRVFSLVNAILSP
jgi:hypothetical protein